jgi:L-cysteine desulfidase
MRFVKFVVLLTAFMLSTCEYAHAQAPQCPDGMVCITPAAARAALEAGDKAKALEAEAKVKDQAIADLKSALADMRVNYAEAKGENTILKQRAVSDAALIELFSKQVRPKRIGINLF